MNLLTRNPESETWWKIHNRKNIKKEPDRYPQRIGQVMSSGQKTLRR